MTACIPLLVGTTSIGGLQAEHKARIERALRAFENGKPGKKRPKYKSKRQVKRVKAGNG